MYTAHAYGILKVMSDVGTSITWIEEPKDVVHRWYTPGTYVRFITPQYEPTDFTISVA